MCKLRILWHVFVLEQIKSYTRTLPLPHPKSQNKLKSNVQESNTHIRWDWITELPRDFGHQDAEHKLYWSTNDIYYKEEELIEEINSDNFPDLIIFNSLLLHPTRNCANTTICNEIFQHYKEAVLKLTPFFKKVAEIGRQANKIRKIVWMGNEDLMQKSERPYAQKLQSDNLPLEKKILHNKLRSDVIYLSKKISTLS